MLSPPRLGVQEIERKTNTATATAPNLLARDGLKLGLPMAWSTVAMKEWCSCVMKEGKYEIKDISYGTGSYPFPPPGLQLKMRRTPSKLPRANPY
jgi:hypothetical protein